MWRNGGRNRLKMAYVQHFLAIIRLAQGDPIAAQSLLDQVPLDYNPSDWIGDTRFRAALYLRDYDAADRIIAATPEVARTRGDKQNALAAFAVARKKLDATWGNKPKATVKVFPCACCEPCLLAQWLSSAIHNPGTPRRRQSS